jgi:LAO/AO transport system kinase
LRHLPVYAYLPVMAETTNSGARERIETDAQAAALVQKMRAGERRATALVITELERLSTAAPILLRAMQPYLGHALVVGFTGPPGAGKSTLVNAVIAELRGAKKSVGVIAVDPSSPVSGGSILGDRIRMTAALDDDGVFVRSLASRGYLGGLSPAAVRVIDALDAAGRDIVLLETVGTGQSEIDVAEVADVRVVISAPGLGDDIQAMKSGLLEIADIMVVNKGDRPGAEQTLQQLLGALSIRAMRHNKVPVLKTTATTGEGVAELVDAVAGKGRELEAAGPLARRRRRARYLIARAAADLVAARVKEGTGRQLDSLADEVLSGRVTPDQAARTLLAD